MVRPEDQIVETSSGESKEELEIDVDTLSKRDGRIFVFHLLYAMDACEYQVSLESVVDNFCREFKYCLKKDSPLFVETQAIIDERDTLDNHIKPLLDNWRFERLGVCTRLIMRLALWEILHTATDTIVIINEAIELAKCFAETDAYKFINGLLDEWVKKNKN